MSRLSRAYEIHDVSKPNRPLWPITGIYLTYEYVEGTVCNGEACISRHRLVNVPECFKAQSIVCRLYVMFSRNSYMVTCGSLVVKVLGYKPKSREFETR
jgi:hypothetical protein